MIAIIPYPCDLAGNYPQKYPEDILWKTTVRVNGYMAAQRRFTLMDRVRIANKYLIPVISYLSRFFLMTKQVTTRVHRALARWLIRGSTTNINRLMATPHLAGPADPLKSPVLLNVASVLRNMPALPDLTRDDVGSYSLLMGDHAVRAAERYAGKVGSDFPQHTGQADIYYSLVHSEPAPIERLMGTLTARLKRHGDARNPHQLTKNILSNMLRLPNSLARSLRNHAFNVVHNLIFTAHRTRRYNDQGGCVLCGHPLEDFSHLFCSCPVAVRAMRCLGQSPNQRSRRLAALLRGATERDHRMESLMKSKRSVALLSFSLAVWRTRWRYQDYKDPPKLEVAAAKVVAACLGFHKHATGGKRRDRSAQAQCFRALLASLPPSLHIFTDGSSYGNPGPAGAGFVVMSDDTTPDHVCSHPMGIDTNNHAELVALTLAADYVAKNLHRYPASPIFFFTDNRRAISLAVGRASSGCSRPELKQLHRSLSTIADDRRSAIFWVPAHAGVDGNETADKLAKLGAHGVGVDQPATEELPKGRRIVTDKPAPRHGIRVACEQCAHMVDVLAPPVRRKRSKRRPRGSRQRPATAHRYGTRAMTKRSNARTCAGTASHNPCPTLVQSVAPSPKPTVTPIPSPLAIPQERPPSTPPELLVGSNSSSASSQVALLAQPPSSLASCDVAVGNAQKPARAIGSCPQVDSSRDVNDRTRLERSRSPNASRGQSRSRSKSRRMGGAENQSRGGHQGKKPGSQKRQSLKKSGTNKIITPPRRPCRSPNKRGEAQLLLHDTSENQVASNSMRSQINGTRTGSNHTTCTSLDSNRKSARNKDSCATVRLSGERCRGPGKNSRVQADRCPPSRSECEGQRRSWSRSNGPSSGQGFGHSQFSASPGFASSPLEEGGGASSEAPPASVAIDAPISSARSAHSTLPSVAPSARSQNQRARPQNALSVSSGKQPSQSHTSFISLYGTPSPCLTPIPDPLSTCLQVHDPLTTTATTIISYAQTSAPEEGYPAHSRGINFPT